MFKLLTAIGLMSGTSGDGIDASIIQSDGEEELNIIDNCYVPFDDNLKLEIRNLKEKIEKPNDLKLNLNQIINLEQKLTVLHSKAVEQIIKKGKVKKLVCPYHAWAYDLSGDLISARMMNDEFEKKDWGLNKCKSKLIFCNIYSLLNLLFLYLDIKSRYIYGIRNNDY